jgi:hypothetical protein
MSIQKTTQNSFDGHHCCNAKNPDYKITYHIDDNTIRENQICKECIQSQTVFDDKFGKLAILQLNILKIICIHCNQDVTKTKGCIVCNTVFEKKSSRISTTHQQMETTL